MELREALAVVLALLFPPAVYCLVLAFLNRRARPVVVSGPLDFLGVLLALSGFLVVGGPAVLSNVATTWHGLDGLMPAWLGKPAGGWGAALLGALLVVYVAVVLGGAAVLLGRRRRLTAVYNVDPEVFDELLGQALDGLGYSWTRSGNRCYLRAGGAAPAEGKPAPNTVLEVEPSPGLLHVTLVWDETDPAVRREVEGELVRGLGQVRTGYNPAAGWFLSAASMLFLLLFAVL
ncbi:MAG TPA: hypothetical protein VJ739_00350, partial [Gemmataceae bacterium]|nr:hypothetical protein [Gemmataceae bacterium]